jgi:predicted phosphodiesterase
VQDAAQSYNTMAIQVARLQSSVSSGAAPPPHLALAHISDIHFQKQAHGERTYTSDDDLRREMTRDLEVQASKLGAIHAILITGDIAFSGSAEEYQRAHAWISEVCRCTGCPEQSVRTIAGNHDVVRDTVKSSLVLQNVYEAIRQKAKTDRPAELDAAIRQYLGDKALPDLLYGAFAHYNDFADKFGCAFRSKQPFWEQDILLNDGSNLRLRGVNSALISSATDNRGDNKLVVGPEFCLLPNQPGVEHLVMCHHPPQWLWDDDRIENYLGARARIVLFGHKHVEKIREETSSSGHQLLRIHAGALNPDPNEMAYQPRYNCLRIWVTSQPQRVLNVEVHRRVWDTEANSFADAADATGACKSFALKLSPWSAPAPQPELAVPTTAERAEPLIALSDPLNVLTKDPAKVRMLSAPRRLAYRFMVLPYHVQMEIAQNLKLIGDEDRGLPETELFRHFFRRAADRGQLPDLWREVESRHPDGTPDKNPFSVE